MVAQTSEYRRQVPNSLPYTNSFGRLRRMRRDARASRARRLGWGTRHGRPSHRHTCTAALRVNATGNTHWSVESSGDVTRGPDKMGVPTTSQDRELSTDEGGLVRTLSEAACAPPGPFVGPDARMTLGCRSRGDCDSFHSSTMPCTLRAAAPRGLSPHLVPRSRVPV